MGHKSGGGKPDFERMHREMDTVNPAWRDNIKDATHGRYRPPDFEKSATMKPTEPTQTQPSTKVDAPKVGTASANSSGDEYRFRARILQQEQAKKSALLDQKQRGTEALKTAAVQPGKPHPAASRTGQVASQNFKQSGTTWAERVKNNPPQASKPSVTASAPKAAAPKAPAVKPPSPAPRRGR